MKATSEILKEIQEGKRALRNTRCKDCNGNTIMELDYIHVENKEYNYEGIVEFDGKQ